MKKLALINNEIYLTFLGNQFRISRFQEIPKADLLIFIPLYFFFDDVLFRFRYALTMMMMMMIMVVVVDFRKKNKVYICLFHFYFCL